MAPTPDDDRFRKALGQSVVAILVCAVAVVLCYFFVDRPVAYFVHDHRVTQLDGLKFLTEPPPLLQSWSPLLLIALLIRRAGGPWQHWQFVLFVACVSLIVADQFRESLGDLFGRYWPETWHNNNPSLIRNDTYGFHPFQVGDDIGSFPSGHAARIIGFATVFWLGLPRSRWLCAILALPMLIALVGMNYHFVGDVIAGSVLGGIVGAHAVPLSGLNGVTKA